MLLKSKINLKYKFGQSNIMFNCPNCEYLLIPLRPAGTSPTLREDYFLYLSIYSTTTFLPQMT